MLSPCDSSCRVHFALQSEPRWDHGVVGSFGKEVAWPPTFFWALRVCGFARSVTGAALVRTDECMVTSNLMEYRGTRATRPWGSRRDGRGVRRSSAPLLACLFAQPVFLSVESPPTAHAVSGCNPRNRATPPHLWLPSPSGHEVTHDPHTRDDHIRHETGEKWSRCVQVPSVGRTCSRAKRTPVFTKWKKQGKNSAHLTQKRHECKGKDNLTGDKIDPRRKTELHCVL